MHQFINKNKAWLIAIGVILMLWLLRECTRKGCPVLVDTKIETKQQTVSGSTKPVFIHDTVKIKGDTVSINGKAYPVEIETVKEVIKYRDTLDKAAYDKLYASLAASNVFSDTLHLDTLGYVSIIDTVQGNAIKGRSFTAKIHQRTVTNNYIQPQRLELYSGLQLSNMAIIPTFTLRTKNGALFSVGYGYNWLQNKPQIQAGMQIRLSFKK